MIKKISIKKSKYFLTRCQKKDTDMFIWSGCTKKNSPKNITFFYAKLFLTEKYVLFISNDFGLCMALFVLVGYGYGVIFLSNKHFISDWIVHTGVITYK